MGLLQDLSGKYKTLSIVGMAKNSGKTTALNYLIEEAMDENITLGITSTGRDGESSDLVTGTDKPKVFLETGTIVSVPTQLYELADAGLEILEMTKYSTAIGELLLCRVAESGYVQIAGPVNTVDHKKLCREMLDLGVEMVLIDGAIDRKSIAAPETSDAIILATGAVLSRTIKKVVEETAHTVNLYGLPVLEDMEVKRLIDENIKKERIIIISKKEGIREVKVLELKTGLGASPVIDQMIDNDTEYLFIPGALTNNVLADIDTHKLKKIKIVLKDPTKIFIDYMTWQQRVKKGLHVLVLDNIKVAAITVNPYSPQGYCFKSDDLMREMRAVIKGIPIVDVRQMT
ncbi:MAG TPA: hypothetical protein VFC27_03705 [Anaerovoracaceae bacterium]|nr:hypothetical protein [Anaerovoracaceae bacterium]